MITQFKRILSKELVKVKASIPIKEAYSRQEIMNLLSGLQLNLQESFVNLTEDMDKKISESKNSLKKANKAFSELKIFSQKKELEMIKENEELRRQLKRSKNKAHELLKSAKQHSQDSRERQVKIVFEKGIQCNMKDEQMEKVLDDRQKQNIFLKQKIVELQKEIDESKQDVEAANVLIKELVRQLETNIADRETWNGTGSSNASDLDSMDRLNESDESFESKSLVASSLKEEELSQASVCRGEGLGEDCSTVDGSNTTNKDYALPEWLQFWEPAPKVQFNYAEEKNEKMWPQLFWNRFRQFMGLSYEI